jgi:deoxycytidine triphosphate deaminase
MTVISPLVLLPRIARGEIIRNVSERELSNPEGGGFDLRLREIFELTGSGYLGIEHRNTSTTRLLASAVTTPGEPFSLSAGLFYLVTTIEEVSLDADMIAFVHARSSLLRSGVTLETAVTAPGYEGKLTFGLHVAGAAPFTVELGARFAHINFLQLDQPANEYKGQWQGGRVSAPEPERQV